MGPTGRRSGTIAPVIATIATFTGATAPVGGTIAFGRASGPIARGAGVSLTPAVVRNRRANRACGATNEHDMSTN